MTQARTSSFFTPILIPPFFAMMSVGLGTQDLGLGTRPLLLQHICNDIEKMTRQRGRFLPQSHLNPMLPPGAK